MEPTPIRHVLAFALAVAACTQDADRSPATRQAAPAATPAPTVSSSSAPAVAASAVAPILAHGPVDPGGGVNPRLLRRFQPLAPVPANDADPVAQAKSDLGRQLFHEPRLSKSGRLSCNSCHNLRTYGVDNAPTSTGHANQLGSRNSPTVYNAGGAFAQFWDGRAPNVEEQAKGPILNGAEMGMPSAAAVVAVLKAIPGYVEGFKRAFPDDGDPVTYDNLGRAIGAFERKLVTPGRWDKFLEGDKQALTSAEVEGLKTFLNVGCMVCHTGRYLGASMFERLGVVEPWPNQKDKGRLEVTKADGDRMMFKVPTLRNVEKTAPYFHDGSAATLDVAVQMMARHQLGLELTPAEVSSIVTWLDALTGDLPVELIAKPELPR